MGGFFLLCTKPGKDRADEFRQLQKAFAELGFASPEIVRTETCVIAAYPSFQSSSATLNAIRTGISFLSAALACRSGASGWRPPRSLYDGAEEEFMGHYAVVFRKNGGTEIKLDRFGGLSSFL